MAVVSIWTIGAASAPAAVLFSDDFNAYADGNLVGQGPWTERATGTAITVAGGAVLVGRTGQDAVAPITPAIPFDSVPPGFSFYEAADVTVSAARTGDYFLHTSGSPTSSSFQGRVYIRSSGAGFQFGVGVTSEAAAYGTTELNLNQTYRIVLRYDVIAGTSNDAVQLYVDPGETEPLTPYVAKTQSGSGDASGLGAVNLRQGATASGPDVTVDNLLVTDSYASAVPEPTAIGTIAVAAGLALGGRRRRR
jgi:hypothetical protein